MLGTKNEALELVQSLIDNAYSEDCEGLYTNIAVKAALICVEKILKLDLNRGDYHSNYAEQYMYYDYWFEVKQEIKNYE